MMDIHEKYLKLEIKYKNATKDKLKMANLLTQFNRELEESLNNEKRFIASVSHELRTPLTAILGYGELLNETSLDNRQKKYLNSIVHSSNHLLSLVNDLLDVAKLGDNRIDLTPKEVDLDDVLNDCANLIRSKVADGVEFIVDIPMPEYKVILDPKRTKQIFINLLSNATKFTTTGTIHFYVHTLEKIGNNGLKMLINVDDTGGGISPQIANTLFEPFQSTDKTQGTGLGLFISQKLAKIMNGNISVVSQEGQGSSFSVTLIVNYSVAKEIGKVLDKTNIMMFAHKNTFVENLSKEFLNIGCNFQNYDINKEDISSSLIHMVASARFYDIAVFHLDSFKHQTETIAGTFKILNPQVRLVALVEKEQYHQHLNLFDKIITHPISHQRFIKELEELYDKKSKNLRDKSEYCGLKLLIVEDVEINREYEKEMLDNFFGIVCDVAENGLIAVEKAKNNEYDAILMDMRMPVMDGLEATKKIREFDKEVPIICMSANVYKEDKLTAQAVGMNDFIEKPLDKSDIEIKLMKILHKEFTKKELKEREIESIGLKTLALKHLRENFSESKTQKLFTKAKESISLYQNRIEDYCMRQDAKNLLENFHALKGVLVNLGLQEMGELADKLQFLAQESSLASVKVLKKELFENLEELFKA